MRWILPVIFLLAAHAAIAGPKITLVVGKDSPALEKRAAEQLGADLRQLFDAETSITTSAPDGGASVVLIGSPKTNPAVTETSFGTVSAQGHVLKSTPAGLIVGGGSP